MSEQYKELRVLIKFKNGQEVTIYNHDLWVALQGEHNMSKIYDRIDHIEILTCCANINIYDGDAEILRTMLSKTSFKSAQTL